MVLAHGTEPTGVVNDPGYPDRDGDGSDRMRVLELTELYPPDIGGTQRHVARQAEELTRRGHQVTVVTHAVGDAPPMR